MRRKTVSLSSEVQLVIEATRGVHALTQRFIDSYGMETELPESIAALLIVLIERLRLVDKVIRGTVDPRLAWCIENDAVRHGDPKEKDLVLTEWSERKMARHHRTEWKRAKTRLASKTPSQPKPKAEPAP